MVEIDLEKLRQNGVLVTSQEAKQIHKALHPEEPLGENISGTATAPKIEPTTLVEVPSLEALQQGAFQVNKAQYDKIHEVLGEENRRRNA